MHVTIEFQYEFEEYRDGVQELNNLIAKKASKGVFGRGLVGWVIFIGLAVVLFLILQPNKKKAVTPPVASSSNAGIETLVAIVPWVLIFAFIWFFVVRQMRGAPRKHFDETPELHRRHIVTFDDEGFAMSDALSSTRVAWGGFVQFEESERFLFLFTAQRLAYVVPKRAFADPTSLQSVRELVKSNISPPISAFPVIPADDA